MNASGRARQQARRNYLWFDEKMKSLDAIAAGFFHAFYQKEWLDDATPYMRQLSIPEAYRVQDLVAQKRTALGEKIAGFKVGCTSKAIRAQFGLHEPIHAKLFRPYIFEDGVTVDWRNYVNCAIEPEMVLEIGKDLTGENLSDQKLIDAITHVRAGIEIHNLQFWNPPPSLQELICSGGIHAGLVIGSERVLPEDLSFSQELFSVLKDEIPVTSAPASEIMGGPLHSLRWLVKTLTSKGMSLKKDSLVIPGSPVELVNIDRDTAVKVAIEDVGEATAVFERQKSKPAGASIP